MLLPHHVVVKILSAGLMVLGTQTVSGQDYPSKPIRVVTSGVGSSVDFGARLVVPALSTSLGRQVIIDNRPSGVFPGQAVAKSPPDGYTVLFWGSIMWMMPLLQSDVPYDPVKDFSPITIVANSPNLVVVHPSLPVKSVKDLIALAKAKPGDLNYASSGTGASNHLAAELFKSMAGVNIVRIPYKNGTTLMADLIGGQVQMMFAATAAVASQLKAGRLKALAVSSAQPSLLTPGLPTVAASGLPGYESGATYVMFAPADTPAAIINRLNQETIRVLKQPEVKDPFYTAGVEVVGSSPQELAATMKAEMSRMGKLIKDAGIRAE